MKYVSIIYFFLCFFFLFWPANFFFLVIGMVVLCGGVVPPNEAGRTQLRISIGVPWKTEMPPGALMDPPPFASLREGSNRAARSAFNADSLVEAIIDCERVQAHRKFQNEPNPNSMLRLRNVPQKLLRLLK
jgi:hypothetical protein